jgi:hypothetical protein
MSRCCMNLKIPTRYKLGSCIYIHSPIPISTSSLLWNQQPASGCLISPNNVMNHPEVPNEMTSATLGSDVHCLGLCCYSE